ncbi:MAG: hypothetical protein GXO27_07350 [Chlorobi bacterium]|nr:hypothetical protein [Chlorobiota bacterium]
MAGRPEILIFVYRLTGRVRYIFRFVFGILQMPYRFTTTLEEFVAYNGPKFSYTRSRLANEFHIRASGLLEEKGVRPHLPHIDFWDELPVIFATGESASIPFDLFSAAFYLITRYEEYLSDAADAHGRFPHTASTAMRAGMLERPWVDLWIDKFKSTFAAAHPGMSFPPPRFRFRPLLSVSISHLYKHKGLLRQLGGMLDNLVRLDFRRLRHRVRYNFTRARDPYDTFYKIIALKKQYGHELISFFPVHTFTDYDRNLPVTRPAYRRVIKTLSDYADTGLLISYYHGNDPAQIHRERKTLEKIIHKPVKKARFHYYKCRLPDSYLSLGKEEFDEDFSCGYPRHAGFRASTAYPFPFYDLSNEELTDLTVHPVPVTDYHLRFVHGLTPEEALEKLIATGETVRRTGGYFQPLFHNSVLSEFEEWKGWSEVYVKLLEKYAENA